MAHRAGLKATVPLLIILLEGTAGGKITCRRDREGSMHCRNVQASNLSKSRRISARSGASYNSLIARAARRHRLPFAFLKAIIRVESNFNPHAISSAGAKGLMQLMPRTAMAMGVYDAFDPKQNIMGGTRYLRALSRRFDGNLALVIGAYHAGEKAVARRGYRVPGFKVTRRYVADVLYHYHHYRSARKRR